MLVASATAVLACAITGGADAAQTGYALGSNFLGELGVGPSGFELRGIEQPAPLAGAPSVAKIVGGGDVLGFGLALTEEGTVLSWGDGALGRPAPVDEGQPEPVEGLAEAVDIAAGSEHGLALLADGHVEAWGENTSGQLGDGTTEARGTPVEVHGVEGAVAVAAGGTRSLALLADGEVVQWGAGKTLPGPVGGLSHVRAIAAGSAFAMALLENGEVRTWGDDGEGQLGDGSVGEGSSTPVAVSGITTATSIAAGEEHALALVAGGTVEAWGSDSSGQLGNGTFGGHSATPAAVSGLSAIAIGAGGQQSLAVVPGGTPVGWGRGLEGSLGPGGFRVTHPRTLPCSLSGIEGVTSHRNTTYLWGAANEGCPFVSGLSASEGPPAGGNEVTVEGSGFTGASAVHFGSASASFTVQSPTRIAAIAPPGSETEDVRVTTAAGTSVTSWPDRYTWTATPVITKLEPIGGTEESLHSRSVTIVGSHLGNVTSVTFGAVSGKLTRIESAHEITVNAPPGSGTVELVVTNASGSAGTMFTYEQRPEFGRCVKVEKGHGGVTGKGCIQNGGGEFAEYEWLPELASNAQRGLTFKTGAVKLQTTNGTLVKCKSTEGSGEFANAKSATVSSLVLTSCKLGKTLCQSEGAPAGTVRTVPVTIALGLAGAAAGLLTAPSSGTTLAVFACGTQSAVLAGSFAAPVAKDDKMASSIGLSLKASNGVPAFTELEGLPKAALTLALGEGSPQPAGLTAKTALTPETEIEVSTYR